MLRRRRKVSQNRTCASLCLPQAIILLRFLFFFLPSFLPAHILSASKTKKRATKRNYLGRGWWWDRDHAENTFKRIRLISISFLPPTRERTSFSCLISLLIQRRKLFLPLFSLLNCKTREIFLLPLSLLRLFWSWVSRSEREGRLTDCPFLTHTLITQENDTVNCSHHHVRIKYKTHFIICRWLWFEG